MRQKADGESAFLLQITIVIRMIFVIIIHALSHGSLAQLVEQLTLNQWV